jgi:hypothetical protein
LYGLLRAVKLEVDQAEDQCKKSHEQDFEDDYNAVIEYANIAYFRRVNFSKIPANITKPNEIVIAIPIELFYRKLKINSKYVA